MLYLYQPALDVPLTLQNLVYGIFKRSGLQLINLQIDKNSMRSQFYDQQNNAMSHLHQHDTKKKKKKNLNLFSF